MCKTIYKNGVIYTVDGAGWDAAPVEAMAVDDKGRILALGTNEEVLKRKIPDTEIVDLGGHAVLPGFIDSHVHVPGTAYTDLFEINLFGIMEKDKTLAAIKAFIEGHPDTKEYFGTGFNMGMADSEGIVPNAAWLDEICADKPVILQSYDLHSHWLNTCAMEANGITKETADPDSGRIHRYEDGTPTGIFTDCIRSLGIKRAQYTHEQDVEAIKSFIAKMNKWGFTSITAIAPHLVKDPLIYREIEQSNDLSLRINAAYSINPSTPQKSLDELCTLAKNMNTDLIKVHTAKYLIDGVLEGNTAWLKEPYDAACGLGENYNSRPNWEMEALVESFRHAMEKGFQLHVHSIGDAATSMTLDAQEQAMAEMAEPALVKTRRNVITHLQLVSPGDFGRMAKLGNIAAIQTFWHLKEPGFFDTVDLPALGTERTKREYPAKSFLNAGVKITNSGDYPVSAANDPFCGIRAGVTRNLYSAEIFGMEIGDTDDERFLLNKGERLTVPQMIEAYTINGAYQMFREDETGSLKAGKWADFIITSRDPLKAGMMELDKIEVLETVFAGRTVYKKPHNK